MKWVDNLLSHHQLPGVIQGRQGVQRQLSDTGLLAVELTRLLHEQLSMPLWKAAQLAATGLAQDSGAVSLAVADGVSLTIEVESIARRLRHAIVAAMESIPRVPRGRPRA